MNYKKRNNMLTQVNIEIQNGKQENKKNCVKKIRFMVLKLEFCLSKRNDVARFLQFGQKELQALFNCFNELRDFMSVKPP